MPPLLIGKRRGMDQRGQAPRPESPTALEAAPDSEAAGLYETLTAETCRSLRYNHFFSVVVLKCRADRPESVCDRIRRHLRGTDHVALLGPGEAGDTGEPAAAPAQSGSCDCLIVAALPETDAAGARPVVRRLRSCLPEAADLRIGLAVFPDDGSDPWRLVTRAAASAA